MIAVGGLVFTVYLGLLGGLVICGMRRWILLLVVLWLAMLLVLGLLWL